MLEIDSAIAEKIIVAFIRDSIHKNCFEKGIIGLSGGLDSALTLELTVRAIGAENTTALLMPYRLSSPESLADARKICRKSGVHSETVDITPSVDAYFDRFPSSNPAQIGNKCARERMSVLYDFSFREQALVVGTSNKSESLIGYSTLYGDSAAAFFPIADLYKTQVFSLAEHVGIDQKILTKPPSADLWQDQTDEGEIGMSYQLLDEILFQLVDLRLTPDAVAAGNYQKKQVDRVWKMVVSSQYKRTQPPVAKLLNRSIGHDFRYLRDWNK